MSQHEIALVDSDEGKPKSIRRFPRLPIRRFPRLSAEVIAAEKKAAYIVELEAKAFDLIMRGREANIQLGRVFLILKDVVVDRGQWEDYFAERFEPRGIALRTGQHYMRLAKLADTVPAEIDLFPKAKDQQATAFNTATEKARRTVEAAKAQGSDNKKSKPDSRVREELSDSMRTRELVLRAMQTTWNRINLLWASEHRGLAETAVIACLLDLCDRCDIPNDRPKKGQTRA
ncbi:MAG: hypothetical protein ACRD4Y_04565 [Candidatus Acidiferrales bacterium]